MATVLKISLVVLMCGVCFADEIKSKVVSTHVNTIEEHESIEPLTKEIKTPKSLSNETTTLKSEIKPLIEEAKEVTTEKSKKIPLVLMLDEKTTILPVKTNCTSTNTTATVKTSKRATRIKKATKPTKKQNYITTPQPEDEEYNAIDKNPFFKLKF